MKLLRLIPIVALMIPVVASAGDDSRWLHVAVDDDGDRVRVNVPLTVVTAALPLIEADEFHHGRVRIDDMDLEPEQIVTLLRAIRDAQDGEYVTVEDGRDTVKVRKEGKFLHVDIREDDDDTVNVRMPIEVLSALVSGEDDELDILAALDVLSKYEGENLVTVNDDGAAVRIWVDRKNAQND
ncbi:MAG: hypothetical protein R3B81_08375 [bacterium]|nr:hypothetical protein [Gemmatimonadota bacterium]